jgi:hypothetical protein
VPPGIREDSLLSSCDLALPGDLVEPGMSAEARLLDEPWAGGPGSALTVRPQVVAVPPLRITLVPVRVNGKVGRVVGDGRSLESWLETLRKLLPVDKVEVKLGAVWDAQLDPQAGAMGLQALARELEARRTLADPFNLEYHYGVLPCGGTIYGMAHHLSGEAGSLGRAMVGWDGVDGSAPEPHHQTLAHELGHAFGLHHAPAGGAAGPDPAYPLPDGRLDCAGFDVDAMAPVPASLATDLMGYGASRWISAYHWRRALDHLTREYVLHSGRSKAAGAPPPGSGPEPVLHVSGCIRGGQALWFPALEGPVRQRPPEPGRYRLVGLDAAGAVLVEVPFQAPKVGIHDTRFFEFTVPVTEAMRIGLATFQIHRDGKPLSLRASWNRQPLAPRGLGLEEPPVPVARRAAGGAIRVAWNPDRHPRVLVLDPASGAPLGELSSTAPTLRADLAELDLLLSDGIRTQRVRVPVQPES